MVSPSRRAVFSLGIALAIAVAVGGSVLRPGSLSPIEQGLVGTWDVQRPSGQFKKAGLAFEPDREMRSNGKVVAQWRIRGSKLVLNYAHQSYLSKLYDTVSGSRHDTYELIFDPGSNRIIMKRPGYEAVLTRSSGE